MLRVVFSELSLRLPGREDNFEERAIRSALETVQRKWQKEYNIVLRQDEDDRAAAGHTSYTLQIPRYTGPPSAPAAASQGMLFICVELPLPEKLGDGAAASDGDAVSASVVRAVQACANRMAARDCLFLSRRRQLRRKHAPGIASKLARMLCRTGDAQAIHRAARTVHIQLDEDDVKVVAEARAGPPISTIYIAQDRVVPRGASR